jgi:peroxiredoxin
VPESAPESDAPAEGRRTVRWLIVTFVLAAGLGLVLLADGPPPVLGRGAEAPDFELPRLMEAPPVSLSGLRGQVVLLNFWATWCKPCEEEMPAMERLYRELGPRGFELVAISVDEESGPVEAFRERLDITFPIALDPDQKSARLYQTMGFPESVLVDREGNIVERYVGPRDWDHAAFADRIAALLPPRESLSEQP